MKKNIFRGLLLCGLIIVLLTPFASRSPDGLEKVAETKNFIHKSINLFRAPLPNYTFRGIKNEYLSTTVSGLIGTLLVFGTVYGISKWLNKKKI